MDQQAIVDALGDHLNSLEAIVGALIIITLATAWAGIQRKDPIEIFSTEVRRKDATSVLSLIYIFSNIMIAFLFWRVGDLMLLLDSNTYVEGFSVVATHKWVLNPYALFVDSPISQMVASIGFGLLILVWWMGFTSLYALEDNKRTRSPRLADAVYLSIGLFSMLCVARVYWIVSSDLSALPSELQEAVNNAEGYRSIATFCGIGLGGLYFSLVNVIGNHIKREKGMYDFDSSLKSSAPFDKSCDQVELKGLPFLLSGWNGIFHASLEHRNGRPIWVRPAHIYAPWFPLTIIGASIWFDSEKWILQRDGDSDDKTFGESDHSNQKPTGPWKGKLEVHVIEK